MEEAPLVAVVTPVYNGERYLAECIESVLSQTYTNWHYTIVNNCSKDSSLAIANRYASKDSRISVVTNSSFVGCVENHNKAFGLISPQSKYCKVISADDLMFPECIERMVAHAEAHPTVGIVNSYQLAGDGTQWELKWGEIAHPTSVFPGREICRNHLLGSPYVFGSPTSCLYRADLVRARNPFYPHPLPHADWSVCYELLHASDFGFVHQVLSFGRNHPDSVTAACQKIRTLESSILRNLLTYGPVYLTREEYERRLDEVLDNYYRVLAVGLANWETREYWRYHRRDLEELGYSLFGYRFAAAVFMKFLDMVLNPKQTLEKLLQRTGSNSRRETAEQLPLNSAEWVHRPKAF